MKLSLHARTLPGRIVTGAYILHAGLEKWSGDADRAAGIHGMAAGAYPVLKDVPPLDLPQGSLSLRGRNRGALALPVRLQRRCRRRSHRVLGGFARDVLED